MREEEEELPEHQGTLRITFNGPVIPHWRYQLVEGDREVVEDLVRRANAVIGLLPPGDPQFRRNRDRVQRDADREGVTIEWLGVVLPERPDRGEGRRERRDGGPGEHQDRRAERRPPAESR